MSHLDDRAVERLRRVLDAPDADDTRYRVLGLIGEGGMGVVYEAEDVRLGRVVALKVLPLELLSAAAAERMMREARVLARLEHPGIVPVHDVGTMPDGRVYVAMKRVRGRRLAEAASGLPLRERLRLFLRVCEAVAFAHSVGVLHRDLKPDNVMVGEFGEVLTLDWGVAKVRDAASDPGALPPGGRGPGEGGARPATLHGTVIGTPGWMAPEQARGEVDAIDERADVHGLGALLGYLVSGAAPPPDGPAAPAPRATPPPLASIVRRSTAHGPGERYPSARELAADVQRWLDGERVLAHREGPLERLGRVAAPHRTAIALVLVYALVRAVMFAVYRRAP